MHTPTPITRELLLIGGGHTHALVLRLWGMNPLPGVRVTVINPQVSAPYSGMLPGFVAGHYSRDELDIDLVRLARFAGARLILGRAVHLDAAARSVTLADGRVLGYHIAALDIGITSEMPALDGFAQHAIPAKPLGRFASQWSEFRIRCASGATPPSAAVIGGGVAGVELAMAMAHSLRTSAPGTPEITLLERDRILPGMAASRVKFFHNRLRDCHVRVLENAQIMAIRSGEISLRDGAAVSAQFIVGAAGARAQPWLQDSGLKLQNGFVAVDQTLRCCNTPSVFAVGDCAHLSHAPRPKAGVFAVRQAPVLFANLRAALSGEQMRAFRPQRDYLKLVSLGRKSALADKWGLMVRGPAVWRLKDRIDRKFMDQFSALAPMAAAALPATVADGVAEIVASAPLCGGCGAKIGGLALRGTLAALPAVARDDVLCGPGDDAAVLAGPGGSFQVISTDHLRAFSNDPHLMARVTAVHALGDIWAMGATAQSALANITLPRLSGELQQQWLGEIMAAATLVFTNEGAAIIGGHSASGAELSIGFTVTGLRKTAPITKSGAQAGDRLILTKPIGTGVILAGDMALRARGEWVMAAFDSMSRAQGAVANLLARAGTRAMTDVTGFGLAGHLAEIAHASGVGVALDLAEIPLLDGAVELASAGVRSSLWADNRALVPGLVTADGPRDALLFDPQTAGGLLAAVPESGASEALRQIRALGFDAKIIGTCCDEGAGFYLV